MKALALLITAAELSTIFGRYKNGMLRGQYNRAQIKLKGWQTAEFMIKNFNVSSYGPSSEIETSSQNSPSENRL